MATKRVTPPAIEPVTLDEAKAHLRVDINAEDSLITRLISDAREWVERFLRRSLITQTWALYLDAFPVGAGPYSTGLYAAPPYSAGVYGNAPYGIGPYGTGPAGVQPDSLAILLPIAGVQSVDFVKYLDTNQTLQTLDPTLYTLDQVSEMRPARLLPAYGKSWPAHATFVNAVQVQFVTGYGNTAADVPASIKQAILLHVGWHYQYREPNVDADSLFQALERKLEDFRMYTFT